MTDLSSISPGFDNELSAFNSLMSGGYTTPQLMSAAPTGSTTNSVSNGAAASTASLAGTVASTVASTIFGLDIGRVVSIALGLIMIIGALFLFKGPDIIETAKASAKDALLS